VVPGDPAGQVATRRISPPDCAPPTSARGTFLGARPPDPLRPSFRVPRWLGGPEPAGIRGRAEAAGTPRNTSSGPYRRYFLTPERFAVDGRLAGVPQALLEALWKAIDLLSGQSRAVHVMLVEGVAPALRFCPLRSLPVLTVSTRWNGALDRGLILARTTLDLPRTAVQLAPWNVACQQ
jgi:hypothetical protein